MGERRRGVTLRAPPDPKERADQPQGARKVTPVLLKGRRASVPLAMAHGKDDKHF
ncbi:MAG: hypothetical protein JO031_04950 [Ktedonobacteraceae bacterium]|nr:hypothetical protein [Ktedonobacteraceae bacterium]